MGRWRANCAVTARNTFLIDPQGVIREIDLEGESELVTERARDLIRQVLDEMCTLGCFTIISTCIIGTRALGTKP